MRVLFAIAVAALALIGTAAHATQSTPQTPVPGLSRDEQQMADAQLAAPKLDAGAIVASVDLTATPLREVLAAIATSAGITLRFDPAVTNLDAASSARLSNTPVEAALQKVLGAHALTFKATGKKSAFIYPDTPTSRQKYTDTIRTFTIVNADVATVSQILNRALTGGADPTRPVLISFRESRTIAVRATPDKMAEIAKLIAANDKK